MNTLTDFSRDQIQPSINQRLTGHPKVDAIHHIRFEGDITPRSWYKHIVYQTNKRGEKKADRLAIDILSDIVYWYRPYEKRDEMTGEVIGWRKKFIENLLQRNPKAFAEALNATERSVRASMRLLEDLGLIRVILKPVTTRFGTQPNVMHIDINPEAIAAITYRPNPRQEPLTIEKPLLTKWECASSENKEAETIEKSLLPKSVCASYEIRKCQLRNGDVPVTKSVSASYEIGNSSIYRDFLETTKETSLLAEEEEVFVKEEEEEEEEPTVTPLALEEKEEEEEPIPIPIASEEEESTATSLATQLPSEESCLKQLNQKLDYSTPAARRNVPAPIKRPKLSLPPVVSLVDRMDEIEAEKEARRARIRELKAQYPNPFADRSQKDAI